MPSDDAPSRIPEPKRRVRFAAHGTMPDATRDLRSGHSSSSGSRRRRGGGGQGLAHAKKEWVIGGLIVVLLLVTVAGLWVMGRMHSKGGQGEPVAGDRAEASTPLEKWHGPVPSVIADRFMKAKSQEERLELIRNPEQVGPEMETFFKSGPGATEQVKGFNWLTSGSSGNLVFETYSVEIADGPARLLSVTVDPQGAKVDFECYARWSSVAWPDLIAGKVAEAAEVRVILQPGGFYLHEFSDEQKWVHFKATSPDLQETLDLYLDRQNPSIRDIQESENKIFPATLSIRGVNGSEKRRQFEITAVKAMEWVKPG
ncbi:hypothetical protein [Luteolibacter soli]|uniref:Outer membrane lipoprotein-sorting protein n=1 Tax=Luteolibacter soli TaxID=3135280 RepID=A0ABU9AS83_9BACT